MYTCEGHYGVPVGSKWVSLLQVSLYSLPLTMILWIWIIHKETWGNPPTKGGLCSLLSSQQDLNEVSTFSSLYACEMHHSLTCMLAGIYWRGTKKGLPEAQRGPDQAETLCTLSLLSCQHYTILDTCVQQGHAFNQAHLMLAGIYWRGHHFGLLEALTASDQAEILQHH